MTQAVDHNRIFRELWSVLDKYDGPPLALSAPLADAPETLRQSAPDVSEREKEAPIKLTHSVSAVSRASPQKPKAVTFSASVAGGDGEFKCELFQHVESIADIADLLREVAAQDALSEELSQQCQVAATHLGEVIEQLHATSSRVKAVLSAEHERAPKRGDDQSVVDDFDEFALNNLVLKEDESEVPPPLPDRSLPIDPDAPPPLPFREPPGRNTSSSSVGQFFGAEAPTEKRQTLRVFNEIIASEEKYQGYLDILNETYVRPIKDKCSSVGVQPSDVDSLFSNAPALLNVSQALLRKLKQRMITETTSDDMSFEDSSIAAVGPVFSEMAPFLKIYVEYVNNYDVALAKLEAMLKRKAFRKLVAACDAHAQRRQPPGSLLQLTDFLIMPIQRIPRYVLLLKELLKQSKHASEKSRASLESALETVSDVASHINKTKRTRDSLMQLVDVSRSITAHANYTINLVEPHRKFIKEGALLKMWPSDQRHESFHFILMSDMLLWCSYLNEDMGRKGGLQFTNFFKFIKEPLFQIVDEEDVPGGAGGAVKVGFPQMTLFAQKLNRPAMFRLGASSATEKKSWFKAISEAIEEAPPPSEPKTQEEDALQGRAMEGFLYKRGDHIHTWRKRYCKLKGKSIFYYATPKDKLPMGILNLRGATVSISLASKFGFAVFYGDDSMVDKHFRLESELQVQVWREQLEKSGITLSEDFKQKYPGISKWDALQEHGMEKIFNIATKDWE